MRSNLGVKPDVDSAAAIGLGNVDNTADTAKPVSTATQTALDAKLGSGATAADSSKVFGLSKSASANRWGVIPEVAADGVMEVGNMIDFHNADGDTGDFENRLETVVGYVRQSNANGNFEFGPRNTSYCHLGTDRAAFYFYKGIEILGKVVPVKYLSGELTLGNGTLVTVTHGLPSRPTNFFTILRCKVADDGYAVGDELQVSGPYVGSAGTAKSFNVYTDNTTQIKCRFTNGANAFFIGNQDTGAIVTINNANWKLLIGAHA